MLLVLPEIKHENRNKGQTVANIANKDTPPSSITKHICVTFAVCFVGCLCRGRCNHFDLAK